MWRLVLVAVAMVAVGLVIACSDEQSVEEDFVQMMEKLREGTFTATYDFEGPDGLREPITWYRSGESQRTDVQVAPGRVNDDGYKLVVLQDSDGSYVCSDFATSTTYGLDGCVLEPTNDAVFSNGPPAWLETAMRRPEVLEVERLESRTFAEVDTRCFAVEAESGEGGDLDVCLTPAGVPLYIDMPVPAVEGRFLYTATSFSNEVPEGIFEPPMEVVGAGPLCSPPEGPLGNCGPEDQDDD